MAWGRVKLATERGQSPLLIISSFVLVRELSVTEESEISIKQAPVQNRSELRSPKSLMLRFPNETKFMFSNIASMN